MALLYITGMGEGLYIVLMHIRAGNALLTLGIPSKLKDSTVVFPAPIIYGITIHHQHG